MAKKRLVVSPMDTSKSIVQPVARAVETYTRPAEERTQNQLATFMEGITPVLKQQSAQQEQQIAERNNAIKSGVIARQAQEARVATYDLLTTAGLEFEKNSEEYLEAGADALTADRQAFFDSHFQKMEEAGIDSEVIASVKRDVQYGNLKFFQEGFLPAKQTHENNKSLNILSKDLLITANANNLSPEAALAEVQKKTKDFVATHPSITWTNVNKLVRESEAVLAATLSEDGLPRGSTVLSDWLVENKQTTTKDDMASWANITNANARREVGLKKVKAKAVDGAIKTSTSLVSDMIMATIEGNSETLYKDSEALDNLLATAQEQAVAEFAKTNNEADTARYKAELANEVVSKYTKQHMAKIINAEQKDLVDTMTTAASLQATPQATVAYLNETENLTNKDDLIESLLKNEDNRAEEFGANQGVMTWLANQGALTDSKYSKTVASIAKKNKAHVVKLEKKTFITKVVEADVKNGTQVYTGAPTSFTNSAGDTVTVTVKDATTQYEKTYGGKPLNEKVAEWYGPRGLVPAESLGIINSGKPFFTDAARTPTQDQMLIASESLNQIQMLVAAGVPLEKIITDADERKRYEIAKFYTQSVDMPATIEVKDAAGNTVYEPVVTDFDEAKPVMARDITSALQAASKANFKLKASSTDLNKAVIERVENNKWGIDDVSEASNQIEIIETIKRHTEILIQGGATLEEAADFAYAEYSKDSKLITDSLGNITTLRIYNTDTSKSPMGVKNLQDLGEEITQSKQWKDTLKDITGGTTTKFGIRWRNNRDDPSMLDMLIVTDSGPAIDIGTVGMADALNNTDRVRKMASQRLLEANLKGAMATDTMSIQEYDDFLAAQSDLMGTDALQLPLGMLR